MFDQPGNLHDISHQKSFFRKIFDYFLKFIWELKGEFKVWTVMLNIVILFVS